MNNVYKGNTPELYVLFLKGEQLEYQHLGKGEWVSIPKYNGKIKDIYRVSGDYHNFRVKPKDVIKKAYMHYDVLEKLVKERKFNGEPCPQAMWNEPRAMEEHLEFTFTNGKLTKIEMKGSTK